MEDLKHAHNYMANMTGIENCSFVTREQMNLFLQLLRGSAHALFLLSPVIQMLLSHFDSLLLLLD